MNISFNNSYLDQLYNEVLENTCTSDDEPCNICKLSINKYSVITLACKHKYHIECLTTCLKKIKECPYCRSFVNINNYKSQCCKILKTGSQCKKSVFNDEKLCLTHIKMAEKNINSDDGKIKNQITKKRNQICKLQEDIDNLKKKLSSANL